MPKQPEARKTDQPLALSSSAGLIHPPDFESAMRHQHNRPTEGETPRIARVWRVIRALCGGFPRTTRTRRWT